MKLAIVYLMLNVIIIAQYSSGDIQLIKETAARSFSNTVITNYLESDKADSISAALLSISNAKDTSYFDQILRLDFNQNFEHILFALGQLGPSQKSSQYISDNLARPDLTNSEKEILYAAHGLVSDSTTAASYFSSSNFKPGMGYAIVNYFARGIDLENSRVFLDDALNRNEAENNFEILFALYRITPDSISYDKITELLAEDDNLVSVETKTYALGCLKKLGKYPSNEFGQSLLKHSDWRIRTEAAKAIVNSSFTTSANIDAYFSLLNDKIPNVSRTIATSIRNINFANDMLEYAERLIINAIRNDKFTDNTRGELFVSLCNLFPERIPQFINEFEDEIRSSFINSSLYLYKSNPGWTFNFLLDRLPEATEEELLTMLNPLLTLQNNYVDDEEYAKVINTLLKSNYPSTISIVADGIDSIFIQENISILQQIVLEKCFEHVNDSEFAESIFSLVNLSRKISEDFEKSILDVIKSSKLYSVKSFAAQRLGIETNEPKIIPDIERMIDMAFTYSSALVKTNKGEFRIKFLPNVAPISVGNFCLLSSAGYFNDVKYHRVVPNFVIQTGDPSGTGWGGPGYEIVSEFSTAQFKRGFVGMASAGPNTEGSQWFVMHNNFPHLNGRYSVFGEVEEGMNVVDIIDQGDYIISVELERK